VDYLQKRYFSHESSSQIRGKYGNAKTENQSLASNNFQSRSTRLRGCWWALLPYTLQR